MSIVLRADQLQPLPGAFEVQIGLRAEHTGGAVASLTETLAPKAFVTPHTHSNDVWVLVQSGVVGVLVGEDVAEARPGDWLLKPRDVPHAMWNAHDEPARILELLTPAGSETWFEDQLTLDHSEPGAFRRLAARYGIVFHEDSPWIEEIRRRFNL